MRSRTKRSLHVATITVAAGLGAAAIGYGAIPDATGTISGCYEKRTGALRVVDAEAGRACTQREDPLVWSQRGPQGETGPQGQQGAQGPAGPQGERGPSDAFVDDPGAFVEIDTRTEQRALILLDASVPAGKFVLWAKATYNNVHSAPDLVRCWLYVNSRQHDASLAMVGPDGYAALALMSPIEGPASVTVNCYATHGYFWGPRLAAVQVARVNGG